MTFQASLRRLLDALKNPVLRALFNLLILVVLLVYLWQTLSGDLIAQIRAISQIRGAALAISFILYGVNYFMLAFAWREIASSLGGSNSLHANLGYYSATHISHFLPTPAWFLTSRVVNAAKIEIEERIALIAIGMEIGFHVSTGAMVYLVVAFDTLHAKWAGAAIVLLIIALILSRQLGIDRWQHLIDRMLMFFRANQGRLILATVLNLSTWIIAGPFFRSVIVAFTGIQPPGFIDLWQVWIASNLAAYLGTYLFGGLGLLREFSIVLLLNPLVPPSAAILISIVTRLVMTVAGILWPIGTLVSLSIADKLFPSANLGQDKIETKE